MRVHREPQSPESSSVGSSPPLAPDMTTSRDSMAVAGLLARLHTLETLYGLTWSDDPPGYTSADMGPGPANLAQAHQHVYLVRELPVRASPPVPTPPAVAPQPVPQQPVPPQSVPVQPPPSNNWGADSATRSSASEEWTDPIPEIENIHGMPFLVPSNVRTSDRMARRLRQEERELLAQDARNSTREGAPGSSSSAAALESLVHPHNRHPPPPLFF